MHPHICAEERDAAGGGGEGGISLPLCQDFVRQPNEAHGLVLRRITGTNNPRTNPFHREETEMSRLGRARRKSRDDASLPAHRNSFRWLHTVGYHV
jgi:hypothetical protein